MIKQLFALDKGVIMSIRLGYLDPTDDQLEFLAVEDQRNELLEALKNLELGANTVDACYTRNPGNFASALCDLREYASQARSAIAKATSK